MIARLLFGRFKGRQGGGWPGPCIDGEFEAVKMIMRLGRTGATCFIR